MDSAKTENRLLIMTAVEAERNAVLRGLRKQEGVEVALAGVGPVAAAVNTAKRLATQQYKAVISAGIAGGFLNRAEIGSLVVADQMVVADLGAESPEGFLSLDQLGFGTTKVDSDPTWVAKLAGILKEADFPVTTGAILTVSTVTGTEVTTTELVRRVPSAVAEGMEGYGVALAAQAYGIPVVEVRSISNLVGPRNKDTWRIKEALDVLEKAFAKWEEYL